MHVSPIVQEAKRRFPVKPGEDYPASMADFIISKRTALAEKPPATIQEACALADELASMIEQGNSVDNLDIEMARLLASWLSLQAEVDDFGARCTQ